MTNEKLSRRNILAAGVVASVGAGTARASDANKARVVTPPQTSGPFYPTVDQTDKDADLTKVDGRDGVAAGEVVIVEGQVTDDMGAPIAGAIVDVWQANAAGRYDHESDPNPAPLDPNFQGWAIMTADDEGRFKFKTVRPGPYPAEVGWDRPPHIHFKVSRRGYHEITTQMYFPGEPLNDVDRLIAAVPAEKRAAMFSVRDSDDGPFRYNVVLAKV